MEVTKESSLWGKEDKAVFLDSVLSKLSSLKDIKTYQTCQGSQARGDIQREDRVVRQIPEEKDLKESEKQGKSERSNMISIGKNPE